LFSCKKTSRVVPSTEIIFDNNVLNSSDIQESEGRETIYDSELIRLFSDIDPSIAEIRPLSIHKDTREIISSPIDDKIFEACFNNDYELVKELIKSITNINIKNKDGLSLLQSLFSIDRYDTRIADELLKAGVDIDCKYRDDYTLLHKACSDGNKSLAEFLISRGASIDSLNIFKGTPLHTACNINNIDIAYMLIKNGANVHSKNTELYTPLHFASSRNNLDLVKLLLEHESHPDLPNIYGVRPIHYASFNLNIEMLTTLLETRKIDVGSVDKSGLSALHYVCLRSTGEEAINTIDLLIKNGAKIDIKDSNGETALNYAFNNNDFDLVKFLLENGANPDNFDSYGITPLYSACKNGDLKFITLFLEHGADPNLVCSDKISAICWAGSHDKTLEKILKKYDNYKNSVLDYSEVKDFLEKLGPVVFDESEGVIEFPDDLI
jgi:ankyrin repeat protein